MTKIAYLDKDAYGAPPLNLGRAEDFNEIKGSVNALYGNVVTELPANDATKVGQRFWYNGTEWTYAYEGQFGTLAAGTVWPVKGYKEVVGFLNLKTTGDNEITIKKSDLGDVSIQTQTTNIVIMFDEITNASTMATTHTGIFDTVFFTLSDSSSYFLTTSKSSGARFLTTTGMPDNKLSFILTVINESFARVRIQTDNVEFSARIYPPTA